MTEHGGGAVSNHGTLTVNGGSFTNNSTVGNGGGIWTNQNISMSGSVTIKDNTNAPNNLYLSGSSTKINVTGAMTGSNIYVSLSDYNRTFTSGFSTKNSGAAASDFFTADVSGANLSLDGGEAYISTSGGVLYVECSWTGGDTDGHVMKTTKLATNVNGFHIETDQTLNDGWYQFVGNHEYDKRIVINGDVKFILYDDCNIEFKKGIYIKDGCTLTIYAQSGGTGTLRCTGGGGANAAIGGNEDNVGGHLVIHGGNIVAKASSNNAAGIGGGNHESGLRSYTQYGGTVEAEGQSSGAGIGGGQQNNVFTTVTIYGGTVTASSESFGAGIGGGEDRGNGEITIYGGTVTATGSQYSSGIGGGNSGDVDNPITIYGGTVTATGGTQGAGIGSGDRKDVNANITIYGGTVTATGGELSAGIGTGYAGNLQKGITIYGGTVNATGAGKAAGIGSARGGEFKAPVSIYGGTINATGGYAAVAIGSGQGMTQSAPIYIYGGTVNATGGESSPAIGASEQGNGGYVYIFDGTINIIANQGAGIGGVKDCKVTINGGTTKIQHKGATGAYIGRTSEMDNDGEIYFGANMQVAYENSTPVVTASRVSTLQTYGEEGTIIISPCEHSDITYIDVKEEGDDNHYDYYHRVNCSYCDGYDEAHEKDNDGKCSKCGRILPTRCITFYEANDTGDGYATTGTSFYVTEGDQFTFPDCSSVPSNTVFEGWKLAESAPGNLVVTDITELKALKRADDVITIPDYSSDQTYYARYTQPHFSGGRGTQSNPFLISNTADWEELATAVNNGYTFKGVYFQMTTDISVTTMVGNSADNSFRGAFDGQGHTLTVSYNTSEDFCGPFRYTYGATIENLRTDGTITTSARYAGGVIGRNGTGRLKCNNVNSSVTINSSYSGEAFHGGLVGYAINADIEGCAFTGSLLGADSNRCGGLLGWKSDTDNSSVTIKNCLFASTNVTVGTTNSHTLATRSSGKVTITTSYYTQALGTEQGTQGYTVSSGTDGLTLDYGTASTSYEYDGIKVYSFDQGDDATATGLLYDDKLYTGGTTKVTFTAETHNHASIKTLKANEETLDANGDGTYTLTMASADVSITATFGNYVVTLLDAPNTEAEPADPTNAATIEEHYSHIADVTISGRTLYKDNSWNTLCLPFSMTAAQIANSSLSGATIKELDTDGYYDDNGAVTEPDAEASGLHQTGFDATDGTLYLYFQTANKIEAGVPYIVKWANETNITDPEFSNSEISGHAPKTIESTDGKVSFVGIYDPVTLTANDNTVLYLGAGNQLYYPSAAMSINAFRAYFQLDGITAGEPKNIRLFFGDADATGISAVENSKLSTLNSQLSEWYSLDGRKLQGRPTKKGVYVVNGKKMVVR